MMAARGQQPEQPQRDLAVSADDEHVHAPTVPANRESCVYRPHRAGFDLYEQ
jgi:hypothetical protein